MTNSSLEPRQSAESDKDTATLRQALLTCMTCQIMTAESLCFECGGELHQVKNVARWTTPHVFRRSKNVVSLEGKSFEVLNEIDFLYKNESS
jgi:hypothetical protein